MLTARAKLIVVILLILTLLISPVLVGCSGGYTQDGRQPMAWAGPVPAAGPGMMGPPMWRRGGGMMMGGSRHRHRSFMMGAIPSAYRGVRNPLPFNQEVIAEGERLYSANCAACHGEQGDGNGPAAQGMWPPPANLRWVLSRPIASDGYLLWAISEGGTAVGTAMPAFKDALDERARWKIISYLRTL
jgi:mono/diheme cytochrome c family protein